uniref:Ionotropic glutamate receptor L-glutamate and glycine-binding domain-containing protein n=1 Tax=Timema poppense TaxID=170557 RepID=A0A7R9D8F9_TIMPO|nr:unnamed protein product [Timema poppensis]
MLCSCTTMEGVARVGATRTHWYELTTVPFPNPIHDIFVLRRLDTWRQGKFRSSADLFREKTADLRGQMLRVVTFQHLPAAVKMLAPPLRIDRGVEGNGPIGFGGMEIEVLITLAEAMSFSPRVYEAANPDVELWGSKQLNGTFSGLIGEVVSGSADVALGNLHYTQYHLDLMDLTKPYITECLTFLTPESLTDNSWMTLILPFNWRAVSPAGISNCFQHIHFVLPVNEEAAVRVLPATASAEDPDDPPPVDANFQPGPPWNHSLVHQQHLRLPP